MNFDGHSCPNCRRGVTRNKRVYKCRCGWSYKEPEETYKNRWKRYFEEWDRKYAKC